MSVTDDRADVALPVTAEVGGEGGSFADPTMQVATLNGNIPRRDIPIDEGDQPAGDTEAASGMLRYPTEPPPSSSTASRTSWAVGLIGAAAGAVLTYALMSRRR